MVFLSAVLCDLVDLSHLQRTSHIVHMSCKKQNRCQVWMAQRHMVDLHNLNKDCWFIQYKCINLKHQKKSSRRCPEHVQRMYRGCTQDVKIMYRGCPENVQKMSRGCPEDVQRMYRGYQENVQRMSRGCPEDVQRISRGYPQDARGHPEGSKGSPEERLGMYSNAYISMSRNHNDSDLKCCCADR